MKTITILKRARKLIAKGWCQGPLSRKDGNRTSYCAMGALEQVAGIGNYYDAEVALSADRTVKRSTGSNFSYAYISYNERQGRTQQQMLNLFDRTIARLEK